MFVVVVVVLLLVSYCVLLCFVLKSFFPAYIPFSNITSKLLRFSCPSIPLHTLPFHSAQSKMLNTCVGHHRVIVYLLSFFFIWQEVINVCKKHLPNMAKGYSSPKLTQYIGDGFEYMERHENEFDVVITDSSDPVGMYHHYHHCHRSSRHPPIWK